MGNTAVKAVPQRPPVANGKTRICVAGFTLSHHTNRAGNLARTIAAQYPNEYETWFYFDSKGYRGSRGLLKNDVFPQLNEEQKVCFESHKSSPFCWLEAPDGSLDAKGGRDRLCEWAAGKFPDNAEIVQLSATPPSLTEVWVDETPGTAPGQC